MTGTRFEVRTERVSADESGDEANLGSDDAYVPEVDPAVVSRIEVLYGYFVALELVGVSILNLTITHGKGAPKHPSTTLSIVGLVASIVLVGVLQLRKRTSTAFAAIIAAFFVTLPPVPQRLSVYHLFALAIPAAYGLILAQRRRKGSKTLLRNAQSASPRRSGGSARSAGRPTARARRGQPEPTGPQASRRYTPPKTKRKTPGRT